MTHTSTPTSSIWLVTWTDSLLVLVLVVSVAFQVPVLVVSAWRLLVFKLYQ
jgi:Sec-independent protein secretion pathway component TatC